MPNMEALIINESATLFYTPRVPFFFNWESLLKLNTQKPKGVNVNTAIIQCWQRLQAQTLLKPVCVICFNHPFYKFYSISTPRRTCKHNIVTIN